MQKIEIKSLEWLINLYKRQIKALDLTDSFPDDVKKELMMREWTTHSEIPKFLLVGSYNFDETQHWDHYHAEANLKDVILRKDITGVENEVEELRKMYNKIRKVIAKKEGIPFEKIENYNTSGYQRDGLRFCVAQMKLEYRPLLRELVVKMEKLYSKIQGNLFAEAISKIDY